MGPIFLFFTFPTTFSLTQSLVDPTHFLWALFQSYSHSSQRFQTSFAWNGSGNCIFGFNCSSLFCTMLSVRLGWKSVITTVGKSTLPGPETNHISFCCCICFLYFCQLKFQFVLTTMLINTQPISLWNLADKLHLVSNEIYQGTIRERSDNEIY